MLQAQRAQHGTSSLRGTGTVELVGVNWVSCEQTNQSGICVSLQGWNNIYNNNPCTSRVRPRCRKATGHFGARTVPGSVPVRWARSERSTAAQQGSHLPRWSICDLPAFGVSLPSQQLANFFARATRRRPCSASPKQLRHSSCTHSACKGCMRGRSWCGRVVDCQRCTSRRSADAQTQRQQRCSRRRRSRRSRSRPP